MHRVVTGHGVLLNIVHCLWRQVFAVVRGEKGGYGNERRWVTERRKTEPKKVITANENK